MKEANETNALDENMETTIDALASFIVKVMSCQNDKDFAIDLARYIYDYKPKLHSENETDPLVHATKIMKLFVDQPQLIKPLSDIIEDLQFEKTEDKETKINGAITKIVNGAKLLKLFSTLNNNLTEQERSTNEKNILEFLSKTSDINFTVTNEQGTTTLDLISDLKLNSLVLETAIVQKYEDKETKIKDAIIGIFKGVELLKLVSTLNNNLTEQERSTNEKNIIEFLSENFNIDFTVTNEQGKTLLDLISDLKLNNLELETAMSNKSAQVLFKAVIDGHLPVARKLIANGLDINSRDSDRNTALHVAAITGQADAAHDLIRLDADIDSRNSDLKSPLHFASMMNETYVIKKLIKLGATIDVRDKEGHTPLHLATINSHIDSVKLLIDLGATINLRNNKGYTPLHLAIINGHIATEFKEFITKEANEPNALDENMETAIDDLASFIAKVTPRQNDKHFAINLALFIYDYKPKLHNENETDPLVHPKKIMKLFVDQPQLIKKLSDVIIDIQFEKTEDNKTKINDAITKIVNGAKLLKGHIATVKLLIDLGATIDLTDKEGNTPLHLAARLGQTEVIKLLLQKDVVVNSPNKWDNTALHEAAMNNKPDVIALLLDFHADINSQNQYNNTAVHAAASRGHKAVVKMLLAHGADLNLLNKGNNTAADLARDAGHADIAKMIEEHAQYLADLAELKHQNSADVANQNAVESMPASDTEQIDTTEQLPTDDMAINGLNGLNDLNNDDAHL
jgi:ankyrin repeat protein